MLELFERLVARFRAVWDSMTLNQKVISGGIFVALFIALAFLFTIRGSFVDYTVLFTELDAKSASEITSRLEQQNIPYRLSSDGTAIEVPRESASRLKIDLTADGLPASGIVGYEILDTTTFGMSERIQEVQIQRALQGELSRTLMSLDAVTWANVNLSIPAPTLFTEIEKPATAAVILRLRRAGILSQKQIEGLTFLVASSVPGLDPGNVTILDTQGNTLTKIFRDETAMLSSTQWDYKMLVDTYLANEAKRMLDGAFGSGNSLVTVNAELDWDRLERSTTVYSQENGAMRSENRVTVSTPSPDGTGEEEQTTVNYEPGQIIENFTKTPGDITRMTVSVFVDNRDSTWTDENGVLQTATVARNDDEVVSIRTITENAVGFDATRGDRIEVVQTDFGVVEIPPEEAGLIAGVTLAESLRALAIGIAILGAVAIFFFILRAISATLDPSKIAIKADEELQKQVRELEEEEKIPESDRDVLVRKIVKTTMENPEIAAKTLKTFFRE